MIESAARTEPSVGENLDDMFAALANFSFRMAVQGVVNYERTDVDWLKNRRHVFRINIRKVGIYIRDSYDFIGDQWSGLGHWNPRTNKASKFSGPGLHNVENSTFRTWSKSGCGGDFLVFSNVEVRDVNESWEMSVKI